MTGVRSVTAGAAVLLFLTATLGSASAQSAAAGSAGKPLPLLQFVHVKSFVHAKSNVKPRPHPKLAAKFAQKKTIRRQIVKRTFVKPHEDIADARRSPAATAAAPENIWPAVDAAAPGGMARIAPDQAPAAVTTEPVVDTDPNHIVAGGRSVQAVLPNGLNRTDAEAGDAKQAPKATAADVAPPKPAVQALVVKTDTAGANPPSPVGSTSWIAHVLAALGGALTAGAVAWFLIRPEPWRTYG